MYLFAYHTFKFKEVITFEVFTITRPLLGLVSSRIVGIFEVYNNITRNFYCRTEFFIPYRRSSLSFCYHIEPPIFDRLNLTTLRNFQRRFDIIDMELSGGNVLLINSYIFFFCRRSGVCLIALFAATIFSVSIPYRLYLPINRCSSMSCTLIWS